MAGAAAVAALVVYRKDIVSVGANVTLVVAGDALGTAGDCGLSDVVDIAVS